MRFYSLSALLLSTLAVGACQDEDRFQYSGYDTYKYFPLDGAQREWRYHNDDETVEWQLLVEKASTQIIGDYEVVILEHSSYDTGDLLLSVHWSSDSVNGILVHGYQDIADGHEEVWFDTPVVLAQDEMSPGESVTTDTDGYVFTSTFVEVTGCGTVWASAWADENCLHFSIDDDDGLETTNGEFTGEYWLVTRYGTAWMNLGYYEGANWNLADHDWEAEE